MNQLAIDSDSINILPDKKFLFQPFIFKNSYAPTKISDFVISLTFV